MRKSVLVAILVLLAGCHSMPIPVTHVAGQAARARGTHHLHAYHLQHHMAVAGSAPTLGHSQLPAVAMQVLDQMSYCFISEDSTIECGSY